MKQLLSIWVLLAVLLITTGSCKKDTATKPEIKPTSLKNTIWTGEYQDPNKPPFPYSMEFTTDNAVVLRNAYGEYTGTYRFEQTTIILNFPGMAAAFSALVVNNEQFTQFKNTAAQDWHFLTGTLNKTTDQVLDNTTWIGNYTPGGTYGDFQLDLKPLSKASKIFKTNLQNGTYLRKAGTLHIQWTAPNNTYREFCVLSADTIKGLLVSDANWNTFTLTKR
ncbi:hypothetical protein [Chitinophaga sp. RAB17]|uniref:hypothetical protein n=1 Tax=Chitinophaga sp. RAB17 TaxID=3233049 RepID=UPI003F9366B6